MQTPGQIGRLQEGFFDLGFSFVVVIELENDVGEALEIRIDRAVERELQVAGIEAALLWIVIAHFELIEMRIARIGERENAIERNVHVGALAADGHRRGKRGSNPS